MANVRTEGGAETHRESLTRMRNCFSPRYSPAPTATTNIITPCTPGEILCLDQQGTPTTPGATTLTDSGQYCGPSRSCTAGKLIRFVISKVVKYAHTSVTTITSVRTEKWGRKVIDVADDYAFQACVIQMTPPLIFWSGCSLFQPSICFW